MRSSVTPDTKCDVRAQPERPMRSMLLPSLGLPMIVSVTSRSVRSLAIASSRYAKPFSATSADAVVISRPGTPGDSGSGRNRSGSTPTGTRRMRS